MKKTTLFLCLLAISLLLSCDIFEDTDFDPIYFVECEVDGEMYRAQTNNEAYMIWFAHVGDQYEVIGQDQPSDFQVNLTLFKQLGEGRISVGTRVGTYLTDISYFTDGKTYTAVQHGGSGFVDVDLLTDNECQGTFEAVLKNLDDPSDEVVITNGKFEVKTK